MADRSKVPIDIQYRKLLEALVDRKLVPAPWAEQHQQIRDGLAILYAELPRASDALAKFKAQRPTHDALTFFDCRAVLALLLASPEAAATNFFGQHTSPVIKKWRALVRLYEKNNVFAAEAARVIAQNTAFEIPFLKKTMQQNEKHVADNKRKIMDLTKSIAEFKRRLETSCAEIGIAGVHFREELQRLPTELPALFADVAARVCSDEVDAAIQYHAALQSYLRECDVPAVTAPPASSSGKKDKNKKVAATGTPTASAMEFELEFAPFEFFTAIAELRAASDVFQAPASLDFEAEAAEIDWDISVEDSSAADAGVIDWGIETFSPEPSASGSDGASAAIDLDAPVEIDWDISTDVVESSADAALSSTAAVGGDSVVVDRVDGDLSTRVGLLSDNEFRGRILNNLMELKVFLRQRRDELADTTNVAFASQFQGSSPLLEHQSEDKVRAYQQAVDQAINQLTDKRMQQLVLINSSDRYLDRHVASLEMLTKHIDKCEREIKVLEDKNVDLVDATSRIQPQIDSLVAATKKLKKELEAELPPLFKGFKVNIVGDVNNL